MSIQFRNILVVFLFTISTCFAMPAFMCKIKNPDSMNSIVEFFANDAARDLFSLNYVKSEVKTEYLNENAWKQFMHYLDESTLLSQIKEKKLIAISWFKTPASIVSKTDKVWRVKVPISISLQSAMEITYFDINLTLNVVKDEKSNVNCGFKIDQILFEPKPDNVKTSKNLDAQYIPYRETETSESFSDLKQPAMKDNTVITAVNLWLLKNHDFDLKQPIVILNKGILKDKYSWRLMTNNQKILVTRAMNQEGIDIQFE